MLNLFWSGIVAWGGLGFRCALDTWDWGWDQNLDRDRDGLLTGVEYALGVGVADAVVWMMGMDTR